MASNSFGPTKNLAGKEFRDGIVGEAIADLRADIETAFAAMEGGSSSPTLYNASGVITANNGSGAGSVSVILTGDNFWLADLGDPTQLAAATKTFSNAAGTASFSVTALRPGTGGNDITLTLTEDAGGDACTTSGTDIALVQESDDATTTTELVALINADTDADNLVFAAVESGAGTAWAEADLISQTNLSGGQGANLQVHIGEIAGTGLDPASGSISWTDSSLSCANATLTSDPPDVGAGQLGIFLVYGSSIIRVGDFRVTDA